MSVWCRYDEARRKWIKTVELVVDEVDWESREPKMEKSMRASR